MTAITIGNFDGVHLGHSRLVQAARSAVGPPGRVVVLSFETHPFALLRPDAVPPRLTTFAQRTAWLSDAGADEVVALHLSRELLAQTPEEFIARIAAQFSPSFIVEGPDFHFGRGRTGSIKTLRQLESKHHYRMLVIDPVEAALSDQSVVRVGSSMIRWLLKNGRARDAKMLLGRPYELVSTVISGDKRGREIGMPTVNLAPNECMLPDDGIYSGVALIEKSKVQSPKVQNPTGLVKDVDFGHLDFGRSFPAAISVGTKPTFGEHPRICEAHLIGYNGPLDDYGWTVRLRFHDWLRDQLTCSNVDLLIDQLKRDIEKVARHEGTKALRHEEMPVVSSTSCLRASMS
jgi:riboflavin kinase/FMN adenylyltransferase